MFQSSKNKALQLLRVSCCVNIYRRFLLPQPKVHPVDAKSLGKILNFSFFFFWLPINKKNAKKKTRSTSIVALLPLPPPPQKYVRIPLLHLRYQPPYLNCGTHIPSARTDSLRQGGSLGPQTHPGVNNVAHEGQRPAHATRPLRPCQEAIVGLLFRFVYRAQGWGGSGGQRLCR